MFVGLQRGLHLMTCANNTKHLYRQTCRLGSNWEFLGTCAHQSRCGVAERAIIPLQVCLFSTDPANEPLFNYRSREPPVRFQPQNIDYIVVDIVQPMVIQNKVTPLCATVSKFEPMTRLV